MEKVTVPSITARSGLRIRNEKDVDFEIKRAVIEFAQWVRKNYDFSVRIVVYIKNREFIKAKDGELVSATCFLPCSKNVEPYARVSIGNYEEEKRRSGIDNALAGILCSAAHELTHYFRWMNDEEFEDNEKEERVVSRMAKRMIKSYATTREHP